MLGKQAATRLHPQPRINISSKSELLPLIKHRIAPEAMETPAPGDLTPSSCLCGHDTLTQKPQSHN